MNSKEEVIELDDDVESDVVVDPQQAKISAIDGDSGENSENSVKINQNQQEDTVETLILDTSETNISPQEPEALNSVAVIDANEPLDIDEFFGDLQSDSNTEDNNEQSDKNIAIAAVQEDAFDSSVTQIDEDPLDDVIGIIDLDAEGFIPANQPQNEDSSISGEKIIIPDIVDTSGEETQQKSDSGEIKISAVAGNTEPTSSDQMDVQCETAPAKRSEVIHFIDLDDDADAEAEEPKTCETKSEETKAESTATKTDDKIDLTDAEDESTDPVVSKQGEMTTNQSKVPLTIASQSEMQVQPSEVSDIIDLDADDCEQETEPPKIEEPKTAEEKVLDDSAINVEAEETFAEKTNTETKKDEIVDEIQILDSSDDSGELSKLKIDESEITKQSDESLNQQNDQFTAVDTVAVSGIQAIDAPGVKNTPEISNLDLTRDEKVTLLAKELESLVASNETGADIDQITNDDSVDVFELMKENEHLFERKQSIEETDHTANPTPGPMEIEQSDEVEITRITKKKECINVDCTNTTDIFYSAPEFIVSHFHLKKRPKIMFVCDNCFAEASERYGELCARLEDKQPILVENVVYPAAVEIVDSSDEEEDIDSNALENDCNHKPFDAETLTMIENELQQVIEQTLARIDSNQQMDWNRQYISMKIESNSIESDLVAEELKTLQRDVDKMSLDTYSYRNTFIEEVQSLDLVTGRPMQIVNAFYPPARELEHPPLDSRSLYYSFRKKQVACWHPCKYQKSQECEGVTMHRIQFLRDMKGEKKGDLHVKLTLRKHMAYGRPAPVRLNVGTRVIALCDNNGYASKNKGKLKNNFYPGVIAEPLNSYTKWRYLVFFDDGYVKYVQHEDIRVVCEQMKNVWEMIDDEGARNFVEDYIKNFKQKRPIVQAHIGQKMPTEYKGQWYSATVKNIDASLVQMHFDGTRDEWIYRGSTRLYPLFRRLNITKPTTTVNRPDAKFEYIVIDDDNEPVRTAVTDATPEPRTPTLISVASTSAPNSTTTAAASVAAAPAATTKPATQEDQSAGQPNRRFASQAIRDNPQQKQREQKRAVAKKSTAVMKRPAIQHMNNSTIYVDEDKPKGKVVYYTAKKHIAPKKFTPHTCSPGCLFKISHNLKQYSPLSKPLLSGWERQICKTKLNKKVVAYRGPCGRRFRDIGEVHKYLRITENSLNVDNFDFDPLLHCLAEYVIESYVLKKADLSEGVEPMPVSMINSYDHSEPPPCIYSNVRTPTEGVNLNLDEDFLCACDCTDDCMDKSKCQCWQLTLAGAKYGNPDTPIDEIGYEYKRLYDHVPLGIYECNSRCKCKSNCLNRVVQNSLQIKLQVFKTVNRGWGIRCLNDIPRGSFVCCYAGNLLTEQSANEAGENLGDEYFAELDYIEVVSNIKEGYESDVVEENDSNTDDEDFDVEKESSRSRGDSDDDDFVSRNFSAGDVVNKRYRTRNSVDTRKKLNTNTPANSLEKRKDVNSSDEEGEVRQQKNFMASNSMPEDPDEEPSKSIRSLFGKDEAVYVMDAKKTGNIGRYFNHSCGPNLFVQNVFVDTHDIRFPWVAFFSMSHIRAGTELTWNYNYEVGSVKGKVLICQCGDANCRGRIL